MIVNTPRGMIGCRFTPATATNVGPAVGREKATSVLPQRASLKPLEPRFGYPSVLLHLKNGGKLMHLGSWLTIAISQCHWPIPPKGS
jgi:hypothetical protein